MRTAAIAGFTLLSVVTLAAQGGEQARGRASGAGGGVNAAIRQVADNYVKAVTIGDAKAIAALYTDDAVEMPPNQPMIKGRAAIEDYYTKLFSSGVRMSNFTLDHLETSASGDRGYDVGTYQQSMAQPSAAKPTSDSGKYVVILKRTGGAWKVAYAIYNSDQAPTAGR